MATSSRRHSVHKVVITLVYDTKPSVGVLDYWEQVVTNELESGAYDFQFGEYDVAVVKAVAVTLTKEEE
jgi:hypothetical protein